MNHVNNSWLWIKPAMVLLDHGLNWLTKYINAPWITSIYYKTKKNHLQSRGKPIYYLAEFYISLLNKYS